MRRTHAVPALMLLLVLAVEAPIANAGETQDYQLFANVIGTHYSRASVAAGLETRDWEPAVTLVYTAEREQFRFFTELNASSGDDQVSRLQAGWRFEPRTTLWIGRFHNPQGFWNTQFHHGLYLQTSLSRPGIEAHDEDGGVLPSHFIGLQLDGSRPAGREGSVRYELGFGTGATLDTDGLHSPRLGDAPWEGRATANLRLAYSPSEEDPMLIGLFAGYNRIPVLGLAFDEVSQTVSGAFARREQGALRLMGVAFFLRDALTGAGITSAGRFACAYVQAEYQFTPAWSGYGRVEASRGAERDPYLALFPRFIERQAVAGLRWDFTNKQALKIEYARPHFAGGESNRFALEWDLSYP
jgi:hypothetical protein